MARTVFVFRIWPVMLLLGAMLIGIPAALIMLFGWMNLDSSETAFIDEVEAEIGELHKPRDVVKNAKDLCSSFEFEAEGLSGFDDDSRAYDIQAKDFGSVHGDEEEELPREDALTIVHAAEKHLCEVPED
jgi:hypothetical protein